MPSVDPVEEARVRASLLLKAMKERDPGAQLKHAYQTIAEEHGFLSWAEMKEALAAPVVRTEAFFSPRGGGFLNAWYSDYEGARVGLEAGGGFLFPYKTQFVVVQAQLVEELGVDPRDADWAAIGFDFVRPKNLVAYARLLRAFAAAGFGPA
jgi:hypothetical protein